MRPPWRRPPLRHLRSRGGRGRPWSAAALAAGLFLAAAPGTAAAPVPGTASYSPPVDAPVVDRFRPPATPFGSGNRGLEYDTEPGQAVRAAAPGRVTFAGQVGGSLHVVVLHGDGIRTSYSFLASITVRRGDGVGQGQEVGTAGPRFHLGARAGGRYLDPALLLGGGPPRVHLVPVGASGPQSERQERDAVLRGLGGPLARGRRAVATAADLREDVVDWATGAAEAGGPAGDVVAAGQTVAPPQARLAWVRSLAALARRLAGDARTGGWPRRPGSAAHRSR
ncbi:MAG: murein hydrolase activator EnvC family protein [Acidimicrobiales bacterium]